MQKDKSFDLINIDEAAHMLRVSVETMRRWDNTGKLKAIRLTTNGVRKYKLEDLQKFINGGIK